MSRLRKPRVFPALGGLALACFPWISPGEQVGRDTWPTCHGDYDLSGVSESAVPDSAVRLWKVDAGSPVRWPPVAGRKLIFFAAGSAVSAVDQGGAAAWSRKFLREGGEGTEPAPDPVSTPLLYVTGTVVFATESGAVYALEAATGETRWKREMGQNIVGQPNYGATRQGGDCVFVVTQQNGVLHCLSLADGRVVWSSDGVGRSDAHPAVGTGFVVVVGCDSSFHAFSDEDGSAVGVVGLGEQKEMAGGAATSGSMSLAGNRSGSVVCVDWSSPRVLWATDRCGEEVFTIPAAVGDRAVFAGGDGKIYAARLTDGAMLWSLDTGGVEAQSPVVAGNRVLAAVDGAVRVLDLRNGREVASIRVGDGITAPAVVDGMLVVGSDGGQVTAFGKKPAESESQ